MKIVEEPKKPKKPREFFVLVHPNLRDLRDVVEYSPEIDGPMKPGAGWIHVREVIE